MKFQSSNFRIFLIFEATPTKTHLVLIRTFQVILLCFFHHQFDDRRLPYLQCHLERRNIHVDEKWPCEKESLISGKIFVGSSFRTCCLCSKYAKIWTIWKFTAIQYSTRFFFEKYDRSPASNITLIMLWLTLQISFLYLLNSDIATHLVVTLSFVEAEGFFTIELFHLPTMCVLMRRPLSTWNPFYV